MKFVLLLAFTHIFTLGAVSVAQVQGTERPSEVTVQDLVKLSEAGIADELIISMIQAADQVPTLSPEDVISLKKAGVSMNVMTAVIQRRSSLTQKAPVTSSEKKVRRIRVSASLHSQKRSWWKRGFRTRVDKTEVSWGFSADRWEGHERLELASSPNCPKDSFCKQWDTSSDECKEGVQPSSEEWKKHYGCYAANRVAEFGGEYEVFDVNVPEPAAHAEINIYYKNVDNERLQWFTRSAAEFSGTQVPGVTKLYLWGADDFDLNVHIQLFMSPNGYIQDFKVSQCEVVNRDEESLRRRILSDDRQYCRIEKAGP